MQLVLILGLSLASGYIIPDFSESDWDTVLFLTPYGIASNFLQNSALKSFYFDLSKGQQTLSDGRGLGVLLIWLGLLLGGLRLIRRATR